MSLLSIVNDIAVGREADRPMEVAATTVLRRFADADHGLRIAVMGVIAMTAFLTAPARGQSPTASSPFTLMVQEGDDAPTAIGGTYSKIVSASIDDSNTITFSADLAGSAVNSAIFMESGGVTQVVVKAGDAAPGGGAYGSFLEVDRGLSRFLTPPFAFLMFHATLQGGSSPEGLFVIAPGGSVETVALAGGLSPRGFHYRTFGQPGLVALPGIPPAPPFFYAVFTAVMEEGNKSFIEWNSSDPNPHREVTTGDSIAGNTLTDFTVSRPGALAFGLVLDLLRPDGSQLKRAANWAVTLSYADKAKTGGKIQGAEGTIKNILGPPGLFFQYLVVPVEIRGGQTLLAVMEPFTALTVVDQQGKKAPGLSGLRLKSFGLPVGNDVVQAPGQLSTTPFGFASLVG
ncbi:MAG TPA: hypothetical protein VI756_16955, partial [Blastocatellia bacterium]